MWLGHRLDPNPQPAAQAGFVEYLRWMRAPDAPHKDGTKAKLVDHIVTNANYSERLEVLTQRTGYLAGDGNTFEVTCSWRIRVGGAKGPESMLLPAFDHLGMPYIPSSTLRGVARAQGIRHFTEQGMSRPQAEQEIAKYLGALDAKNEDKAGKVIFFDAYPLPTQASGSRCGGLSVDIANNIWKWDGDQLHYQPNPNLFFSLEKATFLIGLRKGPGCTDAVFSQVKEWLIQGLQEGIGSQVNTGYGRLMPGKEVPKEFKGKFKGEFLRLPFELEGQLIHGRQTVTWHGGHYNNRSTEEVRPVAFKNMLRYWFRAFALGVLPIQSVQQWEGQLFGAISPKPKHGWIHVDLLDGRVVRRAPQGDEEDAGQQAGTLVLSLSGEGQKQPSEQQQAIQKLFKSLTWLMFHLGGVGQGARRPCYSRQNRERPPWWRGSTLIPLAEDRFWELPETVGEFRQRFWEQLNSFFDALRSITKEKIDPKQPRRFGNVTQDSWSQAVDANCRIVVCSGDGEFGKPYALAVLHRIARMNQGNYERSLCGGIEDEEHKATPSPVWIADLDDYQVVTVFGATVDPRQRYLAELRRKSDDFRQIWPFEQPRGR